jgi:hypothetical protein
VKRSFLLICVSLALVSGCARAPFPETPLAPLRVGDPAGVVERFRERMPERFQLLDSVVFDYNWMTFSGLGASEIDRARGSFKVACMNPMGVKLFELSGDRGGTVAGYSIAAFNKYGDLAAAVGGDIRRIYFDLVPSSGAVVWKRKRELVFRQWAGRGLLEYVFAGAEGDLVEKNYYENNGLAWRVSYYEYVDQGGKRLPRGIVLVHYDYGYRLTVRRREFHIEN